MSFHTFMIFWMLFGVIMTANKWRVGDIDTVFELSTLQRIRIFSVMIGLALAIWGVTTR